MRIGIAGVHGVGKTTLLNQIRSDPQFKMYTIRDEVTRHFKRLGVTINQGGNSDTQLLIMKEHLYNITMFNNMVTDRTALDCLAYAHYLMKNTLFDASAYNELTMLYKYIITRYDLIFYIKPEFPLVGDDVRPSDIDFRDGVLQEFEKILHDPMMKTLRPAEVITLTGTGEFDRLKKLKYEVSDYERWRHEY